MINHRSIDTSKDGAVPRYSDYCFSNISPTAAKLLGVDNWSRYLPADCFPPGCDRLKRVMLIYFDAFGWHFMRDLDHRLLSMFAREGVVSKLDAQFPSTTAAAVTAHATGLPVGQSGVYEWWMYLPELGDLIRPLPFSARGPDPKPDDLAEFGISPGQIFSYSHVAGMIEAQGMFVFNFFPKDVVGGVTNSFLTRGCTTFGFESLATFCDQARDRLRHEGRGLYQVYIDDLDAAGHDFGPESREFRGTRDRVLNVLEELIEDFRDGQTLFLIYADHGQVPVDTTSKERHVVLDVVAPELSLWLKKSRSGTPLPPSGGMRDSFLHVEPREIERAFALVQERLAEHSDVFLTESLIEHGLFGPEVSPTFRSRIGNIAILPHRGNSLFWTGHAQTRLSFKGDHGGLLPEEQHIPLLALL